MSDCNNCKCAPVCALKKAIGHEWEKLRQILAVDVREAVKITVECKYFLQDKDPNIPDRFQ